MFILHLPTQSYKVLKRKKKGKKFILQMLPVEICQIHKIRGNELGKHGNKYY